MKLSLPVCLLAGAGVALAEAASQSQSKRTPWALPASMQERSTFLSVRGGAAAKSPSYAAQLEAVKATVLDSAAQSIEDLRRQVVDEGKVIPEFGQVAETICNKALEDFASSAPDAGNDEEYYDASATSEAAASYDKKLSELETALDAPLQVLFLKQLSYLRETALQRYRTAMSTTGISEYEAMLQADAQFVASAQEAVREGASDWDFSAERAFLQSVMNNLAESNRKAVTVQTNSAQQQQTTMQVLQSQQQMIQQLQMQLYGQSSPWNVGVAYRIPDTNFNLQGTYQQGRANVQLSCVPDEYAPFLGPNGFTNGVGPGNLGLSLNLSI